MDQLHHLLASNPLAQSLLAIHPNDIVHPDFQPPQVWHEWWTWATSPDQWQSIPGNASDLPPSIAALVTAINALQLPRAPTPDPDPAPPPPPALSRGMSPKKQHEVGVMAAHTLRILPADKSAIRIVDIGAGQGYLTRALARQLPPTARILALDANPAQSAGALSWEDRILSDTPHAEITHRVVHVTPDTLLHAIDDWLGPDPAPVFLLALHSCGTLTPDILRAFISSVASPSSWHPAGFLVVGCCYNRLAPPHDFPLSHYLCSLPSPGPPSGIRSITNPLPPTPPGVLTLPPSAYNLAAQTPAVWPPLPAPATHPLLLSHKKIVWRALLAHHLESRGLGAFPAPTGGAITRLEKDDTTPTGNTTDSDTLNTSEAAPRIGIGALPVLQRLGRLPDSAYASWPTFLATALPRIGVSPTLPSTPSSTPDTEAPSDPDTPALRVLAARIAVLHTLRCLLGPVVESLILLDRVQALREGLGPAWDVRHLNLFDQAAGSGRNVALQVRRVENM
ncbi:methyltransferase domain-containing protein [Infundibulicybe gibba]|nr:methyltransferase domain-containing protein [Infundibulicybe gibba]